MIIRAQLCIFFAFGMIAYHGFDNYIGQAIAKESAIETISMLQEIPVIRTRAL